MTVEDPLIDRLKATGKLYDLIREFVRRDADSRIRVVVIGDTMIDEYVYVEVKRLAQEAPVPVWKLTRAARRTYPAGLRTRQGS